MHGLKKSDPAVVAVKPTNNAGGSSAAEPVEPRAGAEGNVDQQSTHRAQIRGSRVTGAGARTSSSKAQKEGEVHCAAPPRQRRSALAVVLRAQARRGAGCGWGDVAGLRGRSARQSCGSA